MLTFPNLAAQASGVEQMSSSRACRSAPWSMKTAASSTSPFFAKWCSGVAPSQSARLGFIPCAKRSSFNSRVLAADRDARGKFGAVAQHQADKGLVALFGGVHEGLGVVGERGLAAKTAAAVKTSP